MIASLALAVACMLVDPFVHEPVFRMAEVPKSRQVASTVKQPKRNSKVRRLLWNRDM